MSTVLEILNVTTDFFKKNKVPDARLVAQYILAHGLKMKRMDLYLNFDRPLTESELSTLRPLVARRAKREPLQHIIGNTSFRGFLINCDKRALIPRPETEMMVDFVIQESSLPKEMLIADIGTGTGAIAIALAKEISSAKILAVDISNEALTLAKENAVLNEVENQITSIDKNILIRDIEFLRVIETSRKSIYDFNIHNEGETVESNPKLRSLREFYINGEKKYFEKHIIRSSGHRIHFREEGSNIYIGYIGKHLKTKKY